MFRRPVPSQEREHPGHGICWGNQPLGSKHGRHPTAAITSVVPRMALKPGLPRPTELEVRGRHARLQGGRSTARPVSLHDERATGYARAARPTEAARELERSSDALCQLLRSVAALTFPAALHRVASSVCCGLFCVRQQGRDSNQPYIIDPVPGQSVVSFDSILSSRSHANNPC